MRVADYILNYLVSLQVKHVFLLTGGVIAFVVDAFHGRKDIQYVCVAHEQAGAMAADAYSRLGPNMAATMVTSGPGATNLITGICCSWFDSVPTLHISGQVNTFEQKGKSKVRQVGFQETEVVDIVKPITKFAAQLDKPENIRYLLEKAVYIARSGRPGPVLIDIPQNFQRAEIDPKKLKSFMPPDEKQYNDTGEKLLIKIKKIKVLIQKAQRPVLLVGGGVRIAQAEKEIKKLTKLLGFPFVTSWSGFDLFPYDYPLRIGNVGVYGDRSANLAVQNADLVLSIGSRLDTRQTGGKPATFAREAKKIFIDIDQAELDKKRGLIPDISIQTDAKEFIEELLNVTPAIKKIDISDWITLCKSWQEKYPTVKPEYFQEKKINAYAFIRILSKELDNNAIIIPDDGGNLAWAMQAFQLKEGQRMFSAFGNSPMGYAFPASIGASIALGKKEVVCIDGDGSIQINIQELQTIAYQKLPIKIFILNNKGYGIIKQFQEAWLGSRFEASGKGVSAPDFIKVGKAYNIKSIRITTVKEMRRKIRQVLKYKGPVLCDVMINDNQKITPRIEYGRPLEDMKPFLPREEFLKNMLIEPLATGKAAK